MAATSTSNLRIIIQVDSRDGVRNIRDVRDISEQTARTIGELNDRLARTESTIEENSRTIATLNARLTELESRLEESSRAADDMDNSVKKTDGGLKIFGQSLLSVGAGLVGLAAAYVSFEALKAGITAVVETGMNFEKMMTTVQAISGANAQELVQLSDAAKQMGETTSFSATKAAEALKNLAASGFSTRQFYGGSLRGQ
jgi:methyl-accepting chemotaxis protein